MADVLVARKMKQKTLLITILFAVLFCVSFVILFKHFQMKRQLAAGEPRIQKEIPLPDVSFSDVNGNKLPEDEIRKGKVVLMFLMTDCHYCESEATFVNQLITKRNDIKFYGIISGGDKRKQLETASAKFPISVLYDDSLLAVKLSITKVPIKIYLEDGVIKKAWGGASVDETRKAEFVSWLEGV